MTTSLPHLCWYAVRAKSRHEKVAAARLALLGISHFLPLQSELRKWTDRKKLVEFPLFPGYLFVQVEDWSRCRLDVLKAPGVIGFVGNSAGPAPIPDEQIESVRSAILSGAECSPLAQLSEGDHVRVVRGALTGIEGTLLRLGSKSQLVISIDLIQRSVALTVSEADVELLREKSAPPRQ